MNAANWTNSAPRTGSSPFRDSPLLIASLTAPGAHGVPCARGVTTRVTMALKFAASILHPSKKSSGPCSISTTQQKVAPRKTIDQAKRRKIVGSTVNSLRLEVLSSMF